MSNHRQDERSDIVTDANIFWWKNKEEERMHYVDSDKNPSYKKK
jgi:hypothetical protein